MKYQVAYNATTRVATVQTNGDSLPSGAVNVGTFDHDVSTDPLGPKVNHVFAHHVREVLYKRSATAPSQTAKFPFNITDMDRIRIDLDSLYTALVSFVLAPGTVTLSMAGTKTSQLTVTPTPGGANASIATWVSSDPTKATVSATGLVTGIAVGTATITATSVDGAKTATRLITVNA